MLLAMIFELGTLWASQEISIQQPPFMFVLTADTTSYSYAQAGLTLDAQHVELAGTGRLYLGDGGQDVGAEAGGHVAFLLGSWAIGVRAAAVGWPWGHTAWSLQTFGQWRVE